MLFDYLAKKNHNLQHDARVTNSWAPMKFMRLLSFPLPFAISAIHFSCFLSKTETFISLTMINYLFPQMFQANSDRFTVVKNVLHSPIITRFIRIRPETWNGRISMRTEFYGCKKGIVELVPYFLNAKLVHQTTIVY